MTDELRPDPAAEPNGKTSGAQPAGSSVAQGTPDRTMVMETDQIDRTVVMSEDSPDRTMVMSEESIDRTIVLSGKRHHAGQFRGHAVRYQGNPHEDS